MNSSLPISRFKDHIVNAVKEHSVTIIKAETGAGKSTQVPQFLLDIQDGSRIVVTQPRRVAAMALAQRVSEELDCTVGTLVGYRTSLEQKDCPATRLLFCTDGLELMHKLYSNRIPDGILILDEVHEWNLNLETLLAWSRHHLSQGAPFKLVIMSATLDVPSLSTYLDRAAVIDVPGAVYPVTEQVVRRNIFETVAELLKSRKNVLVFQPGKAEVRKMVFRLQHADLDAEVFPLHADMPPMDYIPCFLSYDRPKCIVATNVAETSLTIPDIQAVVDSGFERRNEYVNGVEGLYTRPVSLVDREQRKGRAGRTCPGVYVDFCPVSPNRREVFPAADILRSPLERLLLQLYASGMKLKDMNFFHQPQPASLQRAHELLTRLGCIRENTEVTAVGQRIASLPTTVRFGRMLLEAERRQALPWMISLVAIMEQGGILTHQSYIPTESGPQWSDALMQFERYRHSLTLSPVELKEQGFNLQALRAVKQAQIRLSLALRYAASTAHPRARVADLICSLYSGFSDFFYRKSLVDGYRNREGDCRALPSYSAVSGARELVGLPWNFQIDSRLGPKTLRLLTMATRIDPDLFTKTISSLGRV